MTRCNTLAPPANLARNAMAMAEKFRYINGAPGVMGGMALQLRRRAGRVRIPVRVQAECLEL
jgi:hypothetical protein